MVALDESSQHPKTKPGNFHASCQVPSWLLLCMSIAHNKHKRCPDNLRIHVKWEQHGNTQNAQKPPDRTATSLDTGAQRASHKIAGLRKSVATHQHWATSMSQR